MEKLKKIPIIGYLIRMVVAVFKLPKHIDKLYCVLDTQKADYLQNIRQLQETNNLQQNELHAIQKQYFQLTTEYQELLQQAEMLKQWNADRMQEITSLQQMINELVNWNADRMREIRAHNEQILALQRFEVDETYVKKMNLVSSIFPTIWGEEDRLHISALASVNACFFNTNSGHITIDDYTFAGSGVSILAGSHDMRLTGLPRRDCELKEGCDIVIGKGVWLASNCTILGPATIEDNAVIAAGAVVTPETHVPAGTVYGGVPAREIVNAKCNLTDDFNSEPYREALKRENGVVFLNGWSEKQYQIVDNVSCLGHVMYDNKASVITNRNRISLLVSSKNKYEDDIVAYVNDKDMVLLGNYNGKITFELTDNMVQNSGTLGKILIRKKREDAEIFVAYCYEND